MKWKESILIALIFFGVGFIIGWHPTFEGVRNFVIAGLSLGLVVEVVGLLRELYKEHREEQSKEKESQNEKRSISGNLLSEVEVNQNQLKPLSYSVIKALDSNDFSDDDKLPNELIFSRNVYSDLSGKLGLISKEKRDKTHQYYSELKYVEEEYKKLDIRGCSYPFLVYLQLREIGDSKIPKPRWQEIEGFLRNTKKVYDLGTELIIDLKEKTGTSAANEPLVMEQLRTGYPDIRKLWFDCKELKSQISEDKKKIREYIKNKSREGIPLYSKLDKIFDVVVSYRNEYWVNVISTEGAEIYKLVADFATTGKMTQDEDYKEFVEAIVKDKLLFEKFEAVFKNESDLYKKNNEFEQCVEKIKQDSVKKG